VRWSLVVSIVSMLLAFACFAMAARLAGRDSAHALIALCIAALLWLAVLIPWTVRAPGMLASAHKRGMYAALMAWAATDIAVLIAMT
jgi:hypothetical protein